MSEQSDYEALRLEVEELRLAIATVLEEAAIVVEELRHRDIQDRDAADAGEGYDLAIDEAIRALKGMRR